MYSQGGKSDQLTTISNQTETTIITGVAGKRRNIFSLIATNAGATDVVLTIRDTTGGSAVDYLAVKAGTTGGWVKSSDDASEQTNAAANWTAQASATSTVYIKAEFVEKPA